MPLRDHFHPPLTKRASWEGFHRGAVGRAARAVARLQFDGDEGAKALATSPVLAELRRADLFGCRVGEAGALVRSRSRCLQHIERLSLMCNQVREEGEGGKVLR